ncbi:MAG: CvpA family protein [Shimia sp.]
MDSFTLIDLIVAIVIILSALLAFSRGLVRELMSIAGWVLAAILGYVFVDTAAPLVRQIPGLGGVIGDSCELSTVASFGVVFLIALVVVSIFTPLLAALVQRSALGPIDQGLGFLFGVLRGVLLVAVTFFVYETVVTDQNVAMVDQSRSAAVFARFTDDLQESDPEAAVGWFETQYEALLGRCDA